MNYVLYSTFRSSDTRFICNHNKRGDVSVCFASDRIQIQRQYGKQCSVERGNTFGWDAICSPKIGSPRRWLPMNGKTDGDNFWKVKYQRRAQHCQRFPLTSCFIGDLDSEKFLLTPIIWPGGPLNSTTHFHNAGRLNLLYNNEECSFNLENVVLFLKD